MDRWGRRAGIPHFSYWGASPRASSLRPRSSGSPEIRAVKLERLELTSPRLALGLHELILDVVPVLVFVDHANYCTCCRVLSSVLQTCERPVKTTPKMLNPIDVKRTWIDFEHFADSWDDAKLTAQERWGSGHQNLPALNYPPYVFIPGERWHVPEYVVLSVKHI